MRKLRSVTLVACSLALGVAALATGQTTAQIATVAGTGTAGFTGDGGPAPAAQLNQPSDVAFVGGNATYLIADTTNNRIRRVNDAGAISTVAGAGVGGGFAGDALAATNPATRLNAPRGVSPAADGGFLIADTGNNRIRRVAPNGVITTVAGNGTAGFGGDGDAATGASLNQPRDVVALPDGSFLIADTGNNRIRLVSPSGIIATVAGGATAGFAGDHGPANEGSLLSGPSSLAPIIGGGYLIADTGNNRIRRVDATGTITTVAGTGAAGAGGDGGLSTAAELNQPQGVAITSDGAVFIGDTGNHKVREIDTAGTMTTAAGTGTPGFSGDGGLPTNAQLNNPRGVAAANGLEWTADTGNNRIRELANVPTTITPSPNQRPPQQSPIGITPPQIGVSVVAGTVAGNVLIRVPGSSTFTPLIGGANFPLGSELDTKGGTVVVFYETNEDGTQGSAYASQGRFVTKQPFQRVEGQRPGELDLSGPLGGKCPAGRKLATNARFKTGRPVPIASAARRKRHGRAVRVRAKGKVKTKGRYGSAIVRGTGWTTHDFCRGAKSGTLFSVFEGVVSVRDFVRHKTVTVPAGKKYFAGASR